MHQQAQQSSKWLFDLASLRMPNWMPRCAPSLRSMSHWGLWRWPNEPPAENMCNGSNGYAFWYHGQRQSFTYSYILQLKLEDLKQTCCTNSSQIVHVKTFSAHVQHMDLHRVDSWGYLLRTSPLQSPGKIINLRQNNSEKGHTLTHTRVIKYIK